MDKVSLKKCQWCKGSGVDFEGISVGNPYACVDCKGTGYEEGEKAKQYQIYLMNEREKELEQQGYFMG